MKITKAELEKLTSLINIKLTSKDGIKELERQEREAETQFIKLVNARFGKDEHGHPICYKIGNDICVGVSGFYGLRYDWNTKKWKLIEKR